MFRFIRCNTNTPPKPIPPNHKVTNTRTGRLIKFGISQTSEIITTQKPITIVRIIPTDRIVCGVALAEAAPGRLSARFGRVNLGSVFAIASVGKLYYPSLRKPERIGIFS